MNNISRKKSDRILRNTIELKESNIIKEASSGKRKNFIQLFERNIKNNQVNELDVNIKLVEEKENTIVYDGREVVIQKLFNINRVSESGEKDLFIDWMSFGTGGSNPADPSNPISPLLSDASLNNEIVLDNSNSDYADSGKKKNISNKEIIMDDKNDNKFLIIKNTVILGSFDAIDTNISEAGLWFSNYSVSGHGDQIFKLAARATFGTYPKNTSNELVFVWYWFA